MSGAVAHVGIDYRREQRARADNDFYVEPPWAVEALLGVESFPGVSWDPAVGEGTIPREFGKRDLDCWASDIVARYEGGEQADFLVGDAPFGRVDNIVSNPPFKLGEQFIERALGLATNKVAMLLRLSFLEGQRRKPMFESTPLARVWVFSRRVSMPPGGLGITAKGGTVAFSWLVWQHGWRGPPQVGWL